jgi:hypothetical protein
MIRAVICGFTQPKDYFENVRAPLRPEAQLSAAASDPGSGGESGAEAGWTRVYLKHDKDLTVLGRRKCEKTHSRGILVPSPPAFVLLRKSKMRSTVDYQHRRKWVSEGHLSWLCTKARSKACRGIPASQHRTSRV